MNRIDRKFMEFHTNNPHIMDAIIRYTRQLKSAGRKHFGMAAVFERIRWDYAVQLKRTENDKGFKISNDFRSRYARLIEQLHPEFKGFYKTKQIASDSMYSEE